MATKRTRATSRNQATDYQHKQEAIQRPDVGVQDQFQARKPPKTYRFDSSLDPALSWDESRDRELAEWLIGLVQRCASEGEAAVFAEAQVWAGGSVRVQSLQAAANLLQTLSQPFLNWAGKAERHQIEVPTVPLFVHERHSTKAILDGIKSRKAKGTSLDLFGDGGLDITDKLDAYEHKGPWQNRMLLGDSLQIMNSMLEFEGLGGQVQMVYMDPPYGVKFGSNFQPFVRDRDMGDKHGKDGFMTREPEMVKAYRDTWELGLHSYLTYLRDRLTVARELLNETGSIFVQISDDHVHQVRAVLDEVFGADNFVSLITFQTTSGFKTTTIATLGDHLLWYAKDASRLKVRKLYHKQPIVPGEGNAKWVLLPDGSYRGVTAEERRGEVAVPTDARLYFPGDIQSQGAASEPQPFEHEGKVYRPGENSHWKASWPDGMKRLAKAGRIHVAKNSIRYRRFADDFQYQEIGNIWTDTNAGNFTDEKIYVVQTNVKVVERCMLLCTDPGDLVFDPTCGSGTTAYVAEQWGRRWVTCDTSRVPLALARQRLLTATFPYYDLKDPLAGPQGGFVYKRKQNRKGEEIGGLVPHITLKSIANDEPPATEILADQPEVNDTVVRVSGPFVVEATIAPAQPLDDEAEQHEEGSRVRVSQTHATYGDPATHIERMTNVLRQSRTLRLPGNRELALADIRRTGESDVLHAEGQDTEGQRIAIVFGPEDGAISSDVVFEAAREAYFLKYDHLYFFGFAIQAKARELLEDRAKLRIPSSYVTVTPDVAMSDLLKTSRASEIFSITGLPDAVVRKTGKKNEDSHPLYEVELKGLDIFNPATMEQEAIEGQNLPAWMLDTDYNGMSFYATQVFFPKTSAWDNLKKSLKADFEDSVWQHLAGTVSEPFVPGDSRRIAIKVIDERGNELMRVLEVAA
ncbi:site-specific DNA-methyltransferase [Pseudoxanthomonas mexicana]